MRACVPVYFGSVSALYYNFVEDFVSHGRPPHILSPFSLMILYEGIMYALLGLSLPLGVCVCVCVCDGGTSSGCVFRLLVSGSRQSRLHIVRHEVKMQQQQQQCDNALWATLGLNSLDSTGQQLVTRRVIIVGDALSGKRACISRLFSAAMQQIPSSSVLASSLHNHATSSSLVGGTNRPFLPQGLREGSEVSHGSRSSSYAPVVSATAAAEAAVTGGTEVPSSSRYFPQFPHGAGIVQAFILQRLPAICSKFISAVEGGLNSSGPYSSASGVGGSPGLSGAVHHAMTEFFCCDTPGALAMALPTVEALETSVVLLVVDTSVPWRLQEQLRRWYGYLNTHVIQTLRVDMPKQDEVHRMHMVEQQQHFWHVQQQVLGSMRRRWCEREAIQLGRGASDKSGDGHYSPSQLQVPKGGVSPLRTILVCTKTDQLEKFSREAGKLCHQSSFLDAQHSSSSERANSGAGPWVSRSLLSALRTTGLTLLEIVGQLLRKEAVARQSALVAVSSRVNTIATSSSSHLTAATFSTTAADAPEVPLPGDDSLSEEAGALGSPANGHSVFVHPFYKNLWLYIFQLLYNPPRTLGDRLPPIEVPATRDDDDGGDGDVPVDLAGPERSAGLRGERGLLGTYLPGEMESQVSSRFVPHAFLPHGMDHLELLSPFVTSTDAVTLETVFASGPDETTEAGPSALRLHNEYMQQIETALAAIRPEEEAMIWDKLRE
ncbi:hypothetical protein TraAM80_05679 [Trypanosoma rangeli]|uniref:Dynein light intermediate chain n=1 Tax=Trypanosoma rangeli TaxID=5698 RepID=A0A422NDE3_TRYRA|nr:uncharacterized protein TraAM80_05679 [Trypanosoma rangeli]RNF03507.1 hypothetical protein TraAM80_05679 [Trypanosoma rangeli]|eukprot:RNF03507.1 hypothetical protein TraAM80_05679 [Trypanosoma rangeli]